MSIDEFSVRYKKGYLSRDCVNNWFPLTVDIKTASESLLLDIRANSEKTIVLTKSDYYYLSQDKSSFLDEFLLGRAEPKEEIPGYLFFSPK